MDAASTTSLETELPAGTRGPADRGARAARERRPGRAAERWLRVRTPCARWWVDGAVEAGRAARRDVDLVYASLSPYESAEAAARLAAELGMPWVADLRIRGRSTRCASTRAGSTAVSSSRRMRSSLASAAAVVMNTPEAARRLAPGVPRARGAAGRVIPNGFDPADFAAAPAPSRRTAAFRIVHTGYLHTELGRAQRRARRLRRLLGGADAAASTSSRARTSSCSRRSTRLLAATRAARAIELHLAGVLPTADRDVARPLGRRARPRLSRRTPRRSR